MITVKEIVIEYLEAKGYGGLVMPGECGCEISALIPCDEACHACEPGYKIADKSGEFAFLITTKKPKPE